jgi:hypothetical protein
MKTKARSKKKAQTTPASTPVKHEPPARPRRVKNKSEFRPEEVITTNGTMELDPGLLQMNSSRAIAQSIKRSADRSTNLTSSPFHSAMSMLNVLIGHQDVLKVRLEAAKKELRKLYGEADDSPGSQEPTSPVEYARQRGATKKADTPRNGGKRNPRVP